MSPELSAALIALVNALTLVLYALYQRWQLERRTAEAAKVGAATGAAIGAKVGAEQAVKTEVVPKLNENTNTTNAIYETVNGGKFERLCTMVEDMATRVAALEKRTDYTPRR